MPNHERPQPPFGKTFHKPFNEAAFIAGSDYDVLHLESHATEREIKNAYKRLTKVLHPDMESGNEQAMKRLNEAYERLSDKTRRAAYDHELFGEAAYSVATKRWNRERQEKEYLARRGKKVEPSAEVPEPQAPEEGRTRSEPAALEFSPTPPAHEAHEAEADAGEPAQATGESQEDGGELGAESQGIEEDAELVATEASADEEAEDVKAPGSTPLDMPEEPALSRPEQPMGQKPVEESGARAPYRAPRDSDADHERLFDAYRVGVLPQDVAHEYLDLLEKRKYATDEELAGIDAQIGDFIAHKAEEGRSMHERPGVGKAIGPEDGEQGEKNPVPQPVSPDATPKEARDILRELIRKAQGKRKELLAAEQELAEEDAKEYGTHSALGRWVRRFRGENARQQGLEEKVDRYAAEYEQALDERIRFLMEAKGLSGETRERFEKHRRGVAFRDVIERSEQERSQARKSALEAKETPFAMQALSYLGGRIVRLNAELEKRVGKTGARLVRVTGSALVGTLAAAYATPLGLGALGATLAIRLARGSVTTFGGAAIGVGAGKAYERSISGGSEKRLADARGSAAASAEGVAAQRKAYRGGSAEAIARKRKLVEVGVALATGGAFALASAYELAGADILPTPSAPSHAGLLEPVPKPPVHGAGVHAPYPLNAHPGTGHGPGVAPHSPETAATLRVGEVSAHAGEGGIKLFAALQEKLAHTAIDTSHMTQQQVDFLDHLRTVDPQKLAQEYGFYKPGQALDSAKVIEGSTLGLDDKGQLVFTAPHGAPEMLAQGHAFQSYQHTAPTTHAEAPTPTPRPEHLTTDQLNQQELHRVQEASAAREAWEQQYGHHAAEAAPSGTEATGVPANPVSSGHPEAVASPEELGPHGFMNPNQVPVNPDETHGYIENGRLYAYGGPEKTLDDFAQDHVTPTQSVFVDKSYKLFGFLKVPRVIEYVYTKPGLPPAMVMHQGEAVVPDPEKFTGRSW